MKSKSRRKYGPKKSLNGADMYGSWDNGVQKTAERINGRVLRYDHTTQEWR